VYLYSFFDLGARWGGWSAPRPGRFTPRNNMAPIVQEAGWAPGPVWAGANQVESLIAEGRIVLAALYVQWR